MGECRDVTLSEIMSDPIFAMVMRADRLDPRDFESTLRAVERDRSARDEKETRRTTKPR